MAAAGAGNKFTRNIETGADKRLDNLINKTCFLTFNEPGPAQEKFGILPGDDAKLGVQTLKFSDKAMPNSNIVPNKSKFIEALVYKILRRQLNLILLDIGIVTSDFLRAVIMKGNYESNWFYNFIIKTSENLTQNLETKNATALENNVISVDNYLQKLTFLWNPATADDEFQVKVNDTLNKTLKEAPMPSFPDFRELNNCLPDEWKFLLNEAKNMFEANKTSIGLDILESLLGIPRLAKNTQLSDLNQTIFLRLKKDTTKIDNLFQKGKGITGKFHLAFSCSDPFESVITQTIMVPNSIQINMLQN